MMLARIVPNSRCQKYVVMWGTSAVTLERANGWYRVDDDFAKYIAGIRFKDSPYSPVIFEVKDPDAAKQVEIAEKRVVDPKGTVEKPRDLPARELPPSDQLIDAARAAQRFAPVHPPHPEHPAHPHAVSASTPTPLATPPAEAPRRGKRGKRGGKAR